MSPLSNKVSGSFILKTSYFLFLFMYLTVYPVCLGVHGSQKRALDPLELELQSSSMGAGKPNLGSLQEQGFLITEPSFQPPSSLHSKETKTQGPFM